MTYRLVFAPEIAHIVVSGAVTMPLVVEAILELLRHPEWTPGRSVLWDFSRIDSLDVTPESLRALALFDDDAMLAAGPGRTAVVMRPDSDFDVGVLYTLLLKNTIRTHRAFSNIAALIEPAD